MAKDNKFKNKNGDLSRYAFVCGYLQRFETENSYKEIYMEHEHYHVKSGKMNEKWSIWETFSNDELTKAREFYKSIKI